MKYRVLVREIWIQPKWIEAPSPESAIKLVESGDGEVDECEFEYSHTLDSATWTVEEEDESALEAMDQTMENLGQGIVGPVTNQDKEE
jgi:hypothetical protein